MQPKGIAIFIPYLRDYKTNTYIWPIPLATDSVYTYNKIYFYFTFYWMQTLTILCATKVYNIFLFCILRDMTQSQRVTGEIVKIPAWLCPVHGMPRDITQSQDDWEKKHVWLYPLGKHALTRAHTHTHTHTKNGRDLMQQNYFCHSKTLRCFWSRKNKVAAAKSAFAAARSAFFSDNIL